jgi:hypothetical protein
MGGGYICLSLSLFFPAWYTLVQSPRTLIIPSTTIIYSVSFEILGAVLRRLIKVILHEKVCE